MVVEDYWAAAADQIGRVGGEVTERNFWEDERVILEANPVSIREESTGCESRRNRPSDRAELHGYSSVTLIAQGPSLLVPIANLTLLPI